MHFIFRAAPRPRAVISDIVSMANNSAEDEPCTKRQRGQELRLPTSWRWSAEAQAYYEAKAAEQIEGLLREGKPLPLHSLAWEGSSGGQGDGIGAQRKREATLEMAARLRYNDRTRFGLKDEPADFGALYATPPPSPTGPVFMAFFRSTNEWHAHFSPRLAYRTWTQLSIREDELREFGYMRSLPQCVRSLLDARGSFFWQLLDCFIWLREKLNAGRGVHVANTGEFFALYLAVHNMNDGNEQDDMLEDDSVFALLPEGPHDKAGCTCDEYLRVFLSETGPLGDQSLARRLCAPFALYEPSFLEDWAPVPEHVRRQEVEAAVARQDTSNSFPTEAVAGACDAGGTGTLQETIEEIKKRFREEVKVPEQVAAQAAAYTAPAEWFKNYPVPERSSQSSDSVRNAPGAEMEEDPPPVFEFGAELYNHLPDLPLNRADGATIRIGISPFDDGSRWGHTAPVMGQSFNSAEIVCFVMLPDEARPVGRVHANAVERDAHSWGSHSDFFWGCDAISEEFVNAVLTFLVVDKVATTRPTGSQQYGPVRRQLKALPYGIPSSCDDGPLLVIERVFIDRAHRGTELGMDALVTFLRVFRWSLALADIAEIPDRDRSGHGSGGGRTSLRHYFERVHFKPGVPGGYLGRINFNNGEQEGESPSRYHWLSREHYSTGQFDLVQFRLVAALQRLAFSGILSDRLASRSINSIEDVLRRCIESVPSLPRGLEIARRTLESLYNGTKYNCSNKE